MRVSAYRLSLTRFRLSNVITESGRSHCSTQCERKWQWHKRRPFDGARCLRELRCTDNARRSSGHRRTQITTGRARCPCRGAGKLVSASLEWPFPRFPCLQV
jgi:hypothetical protein